MLVRTRRQVVMLWHLALNEKEARRMVFGDHSAGNQEGLIKLVLIDNDF